MGVGVRWRGWGVEGGGFWDFFYLPGAVTVSIIVLVVVVVLCFLLAAVWA